MFKYSFDLHQLKFAVSGEFLSERSWKGLEEKIGTNGSDESGGGKQRDRGLVQHGTSDVALNDQ